MNIGGTIWCFNENRRIYPKGSGVSSGPIWREHWVPWKVTSETSRSWVLENGTKVPKTGASPQAFAFSKDDIDRACWVDEHRHKISNVITRTYDYEKLKAIAGIVNYKETQA